MPLLTELEIDNGSRRGLLSWLDGWSQSSDAQYVTIVYTEERNGTHTSDENQATEKSRRGREPRSSLRSLA